MAVVEAAEAALVLVVDEEVLLPLKVAPDVVVDLDLEAGAPLENLELRKTRELRWKRRSCNGRRWLPWFPSHLHTLHRQQVCHRRHFTTRSVTVAMSHT